MSCYENFFDKKTKYQNSFSHDNNPMQRLGISINNSLESNDLYPNLSHRNTKNMHEKNIVYEDYKKIILNKDLFSQFKEIENKDNIYVGKSLNLSFSKK